MGSILQNKKFIQLVVSATMALLFVNFYLKQKEESIENAYGMVEVLTAAQDIPPQTMLSPSYLTTQKVPVRFMQPGAFMMKLPSDTYARVKGKVTIAPVPEGGQITQANLMEANAKKSGVAPLIPPGKRGFVLRLGNMDVAELILPGDRIDVLATYTVRKNEGNAKATYTILQNILVVGVGRDIRIQHEGVTGKKEGNEGLNLTLALDPAEAERLAQAQAESQGEISIVVRPRGDTAISPSATGPAGRP